MLLCVVIYNRENKSFQHSNSKASFILWIALLFLWHKQGWRRTIFHRILRIGAGGHIHLYHALYNLLLLQAASGHLRYWSILEMWWCLAMNLSLSTARFMLTRVRMMSRWSGSRMENWSALPEMIPGMDFEHRISPSFLQLKLNIGSNQQHYEF